MNNTECDECGRSLDLSNAEQGELLVCPECGTDLEVMSVNPPVVKLAPAEEEDWGE